MKKLLAIAAGIGLCAAALLLYRRKPAEENPEEEFLRVWTGVLRENARVFNGLYSGLRRAASGEAKKPEKVLREWCQRTHYQWEGSDADLMCSLHIRGLIQQEDRQSLVQWAALLLQAAQAAGIRWQQAAQLTLAEGQAEGYTEWDGAELYPGDTVEILLPAWYQDDALLEHGQCRKLPTSEEA